MLRIVSQGVLGQYVIIIAIFMILRVVSSADCSNYTEQQSCLSQNNCSWQLDTNKDKCLNKKQNCADFSSNSKECLSSPGCQFFPGQEGFCNQKAQLGCNQLSMNDCLNNSNCIWTQLQDCESQVQGFGCQGQNEDQCNQNSDFCQSDYICRDIDADKCNNLEKQDCLSANDYCTYESNVQESCTSIKSFCENLSSEDCLTNQDFCSLEQIKQYSCSNRNEPNICGSKSIEDCQMSSQYCDLIVPTCVDASQCSSITDSTDCANNNCIYDETEQICSSNCATLGLSDCLNNSPMCQQPTPICQNKSDFNCSIKSIIDCKLNLSYCMYTPPEGKCLSNNLCSNLAGYQCQFFSKQCSYTPEQGICTIKNSLGCSLKSRIDCVSFPYCISEYSSCSDIQGDVCSVMSKNQCSQQGSKCQVSQQGYCTDSIIQCPTDKSSCEKSQQCEWVGYVEDSCSQSFDCTQIKIDQCQAQQDVCSYIPGGVCQQLNEITNIFSNKILFQLFEILLIYLFVG